MFCGQILEFGTNCTEKKKFKYLQREGYFNLELFFKVWTFFRQGTSTSKGLSTVDHGLLITLGVQLCVTCDGLRVRCMGLRFVHVNYIAFNRIPSCFFFKLARKYKMLMNNQVSWPSRCDENATIVSTAGWGCRYTVWSVRGIYIYCQQS